MVGYIACTLHEENTENGTAINVLYRRLWTTITQKPKAKYGIWIFGENEGGGGGRGGMGHNHGMWLQVCQILCSPFLLCSAKTHLQRCIASSRSPRALVKMRNATASTPTRLIASVSTALCIMTNYRCLLPIRTQIWSPSSVVKFKAAPMCVCMACECNLIMWLMRVSFSSAFIHLPSTLIWQYWVGSHGPALHYAISNFE